MLVSSSRERRLTGTGEFISSRGSEIWDFLMTFLFRPVVAAVLTGEFSLLTGDSLVASQGVDFLAAEPPLVNNFLRLLVLFVGGGVFSQSWGGRKALVPSLHSWELRM